MLAGTLFLIVLLGSAVRRRDIARAGTSSIILNIFRTGREHSVLNFCVCSKYDEYVTTHLLDILLLVHPRVKSCSSLKLCSCLILVLKQNLLVEMNSEGLFEIPVKGAPVRVKYYSRESSLRKLVRLVLFCDFPDKMTRFFIELNDPDP